MCKRRHRTEWPQIELKSSVRYLGGILDRGLRGTVHVRFAGAKALRVVNSMAILIPNLRRASENP